MTPLQQELLDLIEKEPDIMAALENEEEAEAWYVAVKRDIQSMTDEELRENIRAFRNAEDIPWIPWT